MYKLKRVRGTQEKEVEQTNEFVLHDEHSGDNMALSYLLE